ncbi:hypothetical protein ONZ45_g13933 [Pleurotus djamor]|nr:hypothetical protein ONZ45_g13933 [Pleurotus djamor]
MAAETHSETLQVAASPISKLPPEILSAIFKWVRGNYSGYPYWHYSWVPAITHVCATWREVALRTPRLWAFAFLYPVDWGHEVLRRAKGVSLDILMRGLPSTDDPIDAAKCVSLMKAAFEEPHRISSIDITFFKQSEEISNALSELIGASNMPLLESIYINGDYDNPCRVLDGTFMTPESTPRLTTLIVMDCLLDFTTPRFQKLSFLEIESNCNPLITDLHAFCVALGEMHDLVKLFLSYALPSHTEEETIQGLVQNPIVLPSLRHIEILDTSVLLLMLKCARAPKLGYANISLYETTEYHLRIFDRENNRGIEHAQVTKNKDTCKSLCLRFDVDSEGFWAFVPPHTPVTSFALSYEGAPSEYISDYMTSLSQLNIIRTLQLPYDILFSPRPPGVLGHFSALKELFLPSFPPDDKTAIQLLACLEYRQMVGFSRLKELSLSGEGENLSPCIVEMLRESADSFNTGHSARRSQIDSFRYLGR